MWKIVTGKNDKGQEIEIGEIYMKYQANSILDRPVLKMLQLKNKDCFFFKHEDESKCWLLQQHMCFLNLESPVLEIYQEMNVSEETTLEEFQEILFLKYFRHLPPDYELLP